MKTSIVALCLALAFAVPLLGAKVKKAELSPPFVLLLDEAKVGELPAGWAAAKTGEGPGSVWKVLEDKGGKKVLAQTSDQGPNRFFNLCVAEDTSFSDIDLTVAFKAMAGKLDQGGGPVWRYQDAGNYYIARMNPLEDNYRVYKVVAGKADGTGLCRCQDSCGGVAYAASRPQGRPHPVLSRRQAVPRREGQHVQGCRKDRPVDQGRRPDVFCQLEAKGL